MQTLTPLKIRPAPQDARRLLADSTGAVAIFFGLAFIPMMLAMGAAVDYTAAITLRSHLEHLSDSAALAAAKAAAQKDASCGPNPAGNNEDNYKGCGKNDIIAHGKGAGAQFLNSDAAFQNTNRNTQIAVSKNDNGGWSATVSYSVASRTSVMKIVGINYVPISGSVTSSVAFGTQAYLNFHLLLDRSMSMGIGATANDIARMQSLTGCAFGCHTSGYESKYYNQPKAQGIRFRIDDLRDATGALVSQAQKTAAASDSNHIFMGAYAFNHKVTSLVEMTSDLSRVASAVQALDLPTQDDGTQSADALAWVNNKVKSGGTGLSSASPQEIVFLVTDGVDDGIYTGWTGMRAPYGLPLSWWPKSMTRANTGAFPVGACDGLKNKGVIVAVVYTTYVPFVGTEQYDRLIGPFAANISPNLESCASKGFFFVASQPGDIAKGMQHLFDKALAASALRLTR